MKLASILLFLLLAGCVCERVPRWEYPWEKPIARANLNALGEKVRWVEGHYRICDGKLLWVPGHWQRTEPAALVWLETECHRRGRLWVYTPGFWGGEAP